MPARKTSLEPTRIWRFAARVEQASEKAASEILWRRHRYYNRLVEIERARYERYVAVRARHSPALAALEAEWERLDDEVAALYREAKSDRQAHWRESGGDKARLLPTEYESRKAGLEARKRAVSDEAKPLRAAFAELLEPARLAYRARATELAAVGGPRTKSKANARALEEMLSDEQWHPAWRALAVSDEQAHREQLAARAACGLYAGTYLAVEEAFARAKKDASPRPPRFARYRPEGKIQVQCAPGATWAQLGKGDRLRVEPLVHRRADAGPRSRMVRVTLDQTVDGGAPLVVSAVCRLHREIPSDAAIKWLALVVRGRRCELQVTLEHRSFAAARWPAGHMPPAHVALGWARNDRGLRVARLLRDGAEVDAVHCPDEIAQQREHAEHIESIADRLRVQAIRRLRRVTRLGGHGIWWHRLESDRARAWLRARCLEYARHVLGDGVDERWRQWRAERKRSGHNLFAPMVHLRRTMSARDALAWWCWLWAKQDEHLNRFAKDSMRRFVNRRDAHYKREAIRIATTYERVTVDGYSVARLKELEPLTLPGTGVRDMAQWQLHAASPGRFREILIETMGGRCDKCERPSDAKGAGTARGKKRKGSRDAGERDEAAE